MAAREPGRGRQVNEGPTDIIRRPLAARAHDPPLLARMTHRCSRA
nr:MAG TPA: hypothetical protein [Caudoviricetes sp.]